jgi:TonB family protein
MTAAEMHALENEALQDPFLAEALEGIDQSGSDNFLFDLKELRATVNQKTARRKPRIISMWNWSLGIAAGLILLAASSVYIISAINNQKVNNQIASNDNLTEKETPAEVTPPADTLIADAELIAKEKSEVKPTLRDSKKNSAAPTAPNTQPALALRESETQPAAQETLPSGGIAEPERTIQRAEDALPAQRDVTTRRNAASQSSVTLIKGKVTSSEDGSALPGVNVLVKGTSVGTVTDEEGYYQIPLENLNQNLVFGFIGMKTREISPGHKSEIDIVLDPDYSQLSEVVVVGYGETGATNTTPLQFAEPAGGRKAFQKYLEDKMTYPEQALENKVEGRVTVQFTVGTGGQLEDFKVIKGLGYGCDDEVIRLIKEGPAWSPTKRNAQPVPEKVKVRLKFDIPDR